VLGCKFFLFALPFCAPHEFLACFFLSFFPSRLIGDSVNWDCWNRTEDWYDTQCPGKPLIDLTGIPTCASSCFNQSNVCMKFTSNCVCSQPRPDCTASTTTCNSSAVAVYDAWYSKSCEYNLTDKSVSNPSTTTTPSSTTSTSTSTSTVTTAGNSGGGNGGSLSKGAVVGVAIGAFAGTIGLGALLYFIFFRKPENSVHDYSAAPSGPAEMEDSSRPKVRSELMSDGVHPAPLVEAPGDNSQRA